jgi:hypothetical protein
MWNWWRRRKARRQQVEREADKLIHDFGADAYRFARLMAHHSEGALGQHWAAVAEEIARRTDRKV